jgi:hypothetical protein
MYFHVRKRVASDCDCQLLSAVSHNFALYRANFDILPLPSIRICQCSRRGFNSRAMGFELNSIAVVMLSPRESLSPRSIFCDAADAALR